MFYKVEKWTRDGTKVDSLLYAGNSLGRARSIFERAIKHRPRCRLCSRLRVWSTDRPSEGTMANLIEEAIACDDGDRAAKIIQEALGIEWTTSSTIVSRRPGRPIASSAVASSASGCRLEARF